MNHAPALAPIAPVARLDRIDHRPAEAPFVRIVREAAAGKPAAWRADLRFFVIAYLAALIMFLSWLA